MQFFHPRFKFFLRFSQKGARGGPMARKSGFLRMAAVAGLITTMPKAMAQQALSVGIPDVRIAASNAPTGIRTDRLSAKHLHVWNSVREIVIAKDRAGRLLHPRLYELWQAVEKSGHQVFIEFPGGVKKSSCKAGEFVIEKLDPSGRPHVVSIMLFLPTIDRAFAGKDVPGSASFAPFAGLGRKERYVETLGHEMAHGAALFRDPGYLRLITERDREVGELSVLRSRLNDPTSDQEMQKRAEKLRLIVRELKSPP